MWYAVTAHPVSLKIKDKRKKFYSADIEVIIKADSIEKLDTKLKETIKKYPKETGRYLHAGIKFIEANNIVEAKRKSKSVPIYFDHLGQYHIL